jgi:alpha-L-fucosidase
MAAVTLTRRHFLETSVLAGAAACLPSGAAAWWQAGRPRPTAAQLAWQRDELAMFIHFGVNTFSDREWGDGKELPSSFAPSKLDARQWARAAKQAGFRAMILTAKHHDGFCLWPTRTTTHSIAASPFRGGAGDVVREFVDACRVEGLAPGLYLSPWDRNHPAYGDSNAYNNVYIAQLTELLLNYGKLSEVWFDGANGEGPNGRRQVYDWPRVWAAVKRMQPDAVVFSDAGPDVRWGGNESGVAGDPNWSTVDPAKVPAPGVSGPGIIDALQHGDRDGSVWRPAESDTSIRPGWFYHPAEDGRVKTAEQLANLYLRSVGRNSKLLLNVPPTPEGLLHETDVQRLNGMHELLRGWFAAVAVNRETVSLAGRVREVTLTRPSPVALIRLNEAIARGQHIARYKTEGFDGAQWIELSRGTTVGFAKIDRVTVPTVVQRLRVTVEETAGSANPSVRINVYPPV